MGADQIFKVDEGSLKLELVYDLSKDRQASPMMGDDELDDDMEFVENIFEMNSANEIMLVMSDGTLKHLYQSEQSEEVELVSGVEKHPLLLDG